MAFVPRLTAPSTTDRKWISNQSPYGGLNKCQIINYTTGSVLPNCVGYCWGRFYEILGSEPTLSIHDAGLWYDYTEDGYPRSEHIPNLGAVACFRSTTGGAGHVSSVEKINYSSSGNIVSVITGNSAWRGNRFWIETDTYRNGKLIRPYSGYEFQGFILNPNEEKPVKKLPLIYYLRRI